MPMDIAALMTRAQANMADFHRATGALCTIQNATLDVTTGIYGPPYTTQVANVYVSIASIATIGNPNIINTAVNLGISTNDYRLLTVAVGQAVFRQGTRIVKQPVTGTSDTYEVVQAMAPDETTAFDVVLHCQKIG